MPGRLHQVHVEFSPAEDRILLKLNTVDRQEFRFWLTRRFIKSFWDALQKALERVGSAGAQSDPAMRKAMVEFEQEKAAPPERFKKQFSAEPAAFPIGEAPQLITGCTFTPPKRAGAAGRIAFQTREGHQVGLPADATLLHSLSKMLININARTGWDLKLEAGYALGEEPAKTARVH